MNERFSWRDFDWALLAAVLVLSGLGVLEVYSATRNTVLEGLYLRQILWVGAGLVLLWIVSSIDYHWLVQQTPTLYVLTLGGLVAVLMFAPVVNGARRWLPLPALSAAMPCFRIGSSAAPMTKRCSPASSIRWE